MKCSAASGVTAPLRSWYAASRPVMDSVAVQLCPTTSPACGNSDMRLFTSSMRAMFSARSV